MAVKQITIQTIATAGIYPHIIYIDTDETVAQITTAGWLNNLAGFWGYQFDERYIALVTTKTAPNARPTQVAWYDVSYTSADGWSLTASSSSGTVNTGTANQLAYYATSTNAVSGLSLGNGATLVTSAAGVPAALANPAATGKFLRSVSGQPPAWSTATIADTFAVNTVPNVTALNTISGTTLTDGQFLIGATGAGAIAATISAGTGMGVTVGANSVTVTANANTRSYDQAFNAGYTTAMAGEDLVVQTYGELVVGRAGTITGEVGYIGTAGTGQAVIVDVEINGTTIYTVAPQFGDGSNSLTAGTLDGTQSFVAGDRITFKVTQVGSGTAGNSMRFTILANTTA